MKILISKGGAKKIKCSNVYMICRAAINFNFSSMTSNKVFFKRTSLTTRNSGPKFCVRNMVLVKNLTKRKPTSSLQKLEPIRYTPANLIKNEAQQPKRHMAYLNQIKRLSSKTNTRLGIEQNMEKNPFGTKNANPGDPKNHLCLTDIKFKISRTLTSSAGLTGNPKEYHELAAPGPIILPKITKKIKKKLIKQEFNGHKVVYKEFKNKPQYFFKGYLKKEAILRHSFTKHYYLKMHIGNLRTASKMFRLQQQHPVYYKKAQDFLHEFMTYKHIDLTEKEKYYLLKYFIKHIFIDAKKI